VVGDHQRREHSRRLSGKKQYRSQDGWQHTRRLRPSIAPAPPASPVTAAPIASAPVRSAPISPAPIRSAPIPSAPVAPPPVAPSPIAPPPIPSAPLHCLGPGGIKVGLRGNRRLGRRMRSGRTRLRERRHGHGNGRNCCAGCGQAERKLQNVPSCDGLHGSLLQRSYSHSTSAALNGSLEHDPERGNDF
jgi:hypothetical protein